MLTWIRRLFGRSRPPAPHPLVVLARDPDPDARRRAADELAAVDDPWAARATIDLLLADTHAAVRDAARAALLRRAPAVVPQLIGGLSHGREEVARACAELLGELRAEAAVEPLLVSLKYGPRPVQLAARQALVRIGSPATAALESARGETQPWVRRQIEEALAEIAAAVPTLTPARPAPEV